MYRVYKSLVTKWNPNRNPSNKVEDEAKFQEINEPFKAINENKAKEKSKSCNDPIVSSPGGSSHHRKSMEESLFYRPAILLKSLSRKSSSQSTSPTFLPKSASSRDNSSKNESHRRGSSDMEKLVLQTSMSRLSPRSSIIFSQSTHLRKPPPIEKKLECTLEELCYGCVKQIMISRDVIINGIIEQQGEMVSITVKPGWKRGTRITFDGKGDERPGYQPADLIMVIDEKPHLLFEREDDDLVYKVEIPLVKALVGCSLSVPLLEGEKMSLSFDLIFPGYVKIIKGQGMPIAKEIGKRGDLRINFLINFPMFLSSEQRFDASTILKDCSYLDFL
ncbi:DNAJ-like protein SUBFAMILY C MEMBER [Salix viminalis]|uniref:DNAJ-like protein SUBFAMILY C MEMBER n=1 Tax=Salix viminalis TaxID=40686 RepID=A0A9Q0TPN2_SALVM|nr:DNAJ-like protein SUBFAMILY C MEMBER [Salix viminalis]